MSKTDSAIPVHIIAVLDRSGSMQSLRSDVIGGFNKFLAEQQANEGKCRLTLVQFDSGDPFEVLHDGPIAEAKPLNQERFVPRGATPLLDAEGRAIAQGRARAADRKTRGKKAEAVIFVTFTDGMENASTEWSHARLSADKKACEEDGWVFIYLGVGHDGYGQSATIGTQRANTSSVVPTSAGVAASYAGATQVTTLLRSAAAVGDTATLDCAVTNAYAATNTAKADEDEDLKMGTSTKDFVSKS